MAIRPSALILGLSLALAAPAFAQSDPFAPAASGEQASAMPVLKGALPGDSKLSCPEILAESQFRTKELEILQEAMDKVEVNPSARTQAITAAMQAVSLLAGALPMPVPVANAAGKAVATAQMQSFSKDFQEAYAPLDTQFDFALERMDLMNALYQRKCMGKNMGKKK